MTYGLYKFPQPKEAITSFILKALRRSAVLFFPHRRYLLCFVCVRVIKSGLTSVADGGRSSWFLSVIRAAELSAPRRAGGHHCLRFHSPGAQQQAQQKTRFKVNYRGVYRMRFCFYC